MQPLTKAPRSTRIRNALLVLGTCAVCAIAAEIGFRVLNVQPGRGPYDPNMPDRELGMRPIPDQAQKADFPEYNGTLILETNNRGFYQSRNTAPVPEPGVLRTVVLGDSFIAGASNANENIPSVIETLWNAARPEHRIEVLNAGAGRYSPYHCYVRLKTDLLKLQPKHIIVAEYAGNDFLDMIRQDDRPYLTRTADGTFQPHSPRFVSYSDPSQPPELLDHSRLYAVLRGALGPTIRYQYSRIRIMHENLSDFGYGSSEIFRYLVEVAKLDRIAHGMMLQILHQQVWFDRFPETLPLSLKVNRYVVQLFRDLCKANGIRLTYTVIPSKAVMEPEWMADLYTKLQQHDAKWTPQRVADFENRLIDDTMHACQELGVEYIDLREGIRSRKKGQPMYYPADMHMNAIGNRAVGEVLASALLTSG